MDLNAPPVAVEATTLRRSKRTRAQTRPPVDESSKGTGRSNKNPKRSSNATDGSRNQEENECSPDDSEESRSKSKRNRTPESAPRPDPSLIEVIRGNANQIPHSVVNWIERYRKDSRSAMAELLSMLFQSCGAKCYIKEDYIDCTDVDDVMVDLIKIAKNNHFDDEYDHLSSKNQENLVLFWDNLVIECQKKKQNPFDKCIDYIIALSGSPPRLYRQIASLIGLQLVTSFISVAKSLSSKRQVNAIEKMMLRLFSKLFEHRYRDIDPNIRMACIQSFGVWILSYPKFFLKDSYLKYLGWMLNDENANVRKASVLALHNLYQVDSNVRKLGVFTERFSSRIIELINDVDVSVAVSAVGLVKELFRHKLLSDDDMSPLYDYDDLLIDDQPEIRHGIGELLYDHLIAQKRSKGRNGSKVHLERVLKILREFSTDDPVLTIYVIDNVWDYMKGMKDWKCIISMLLDKNLTDATNLVRLLFASVRKAVGEKIVPDSDSRKQCFTKAQKEEFERNRRDITVAMTKNYPLLLRKFMSDNAKFQPLVEVILYMNLDLYSVKNFKDVLELIKDGFFEHSDKDTLKSCVKAIKFCLVKKCGVNKLKDLEYELIAKLKSASKQVMNGDQGDDDSLLVNLKRLYELQLARPVSIERSLYDDIVSVLHSLRKVNLLDDELIGFLLLNMYLHVAWSLHSTLNSETVTEASISSLLSKRDTLLEELDYFLNSDSKDGRNQLGYRVCTILSDIWCLFRKKIFASTNLDRLGYCPDISVVEKFWILCEHLLTNNISDDENHEMNKEYVEDTNRDALMIAVGKLIANDAVSKEYLASEIISHFAVNPDISKNLIASLKKKEDGISAVFLSALKKAFHRCFVECKDVAAKLSGTFVGAARNKHRLDLLKIVEEGIEYAFVDPPKQLSFLEAGVIQFASKLGSTDVYDILMDVKKRTAENVITEEDRSEWRPCFAFVERLEEKYAKKGTGARRTDCPKKRPREEETLS